MTREDIIRMAWEAGANRSYNPDKWDILEIRDTDLERFAELVAAHEREEILREMTSNITTLYCSPNPLEILRITKEGVWANPDIPVDEAAKKVLEAIEHNIKVLVQKAVEEEREKVARWMMERGYATGHGDTIQELIKEVEWQAQEKEREACAKVADRQNGDDEQDLESCVWSKAARHIAAAIRARG